MRMLADGREFNLTRSPMPGNRLPKRSNGTVALVLNGAPFLAPVTNNRAWSKTPDAWLDYIWVSIAGCAYYATLDPAESSIDFAGVECVTDNGTASRKDPVRVQSDRANRDDARVAKFKETWRTRNGVPLAVAATVTGFPDGEAE